jgi:hypothetical protein
MELDIDILTNLFSISSLAPGGFYIGAPTVIVLFLKIAAEK